MGTYQPHLVVIEAYEGQIEALDAGRAAAVAAQGLGLPLDALAAELECRFTVLSWEGWYRHEPWSAYPATRPTVPETPQPLVSRFDRRYVTRRPIHPRDPETGVDVAEARMSPAAFGLINDSGLHFFLACCLHDELQRLMAHDPFAAVIVPTWGGLGYVAQMARATRTPGALDVPFIGLVTDSAASRQMANQEGLWTRKAIVTRQMEDLSLALADEVVAFGERGLRLATAGRLPEAPAPVRVPRAVDGLTLTRIAALADTPSQATTAQLYLHGPQQAATGVLVALDACALLARDGVTLEHPVVSAGPDMVFAPMKPRSFVSYWSSRGFARTLLEEGRWAWAQPGWRPTGALPVRLYPSLFAHLPEIWSTLAAGELVLLSDAAAEGLAPGEQLPAEVCLGEPTAAALAERLEAIAALPLSRLDELRQEVCRRVIAARSTAQADLLAGAAVIRRLLSARPAPQSLERVAVLLLDRRAPLRQLAEAYVPPAPVVDPSLRPGALTVIVCCYEMGTMLVDTVKSVWAATRCPDEIIIVDDGSYGGETLAAISTLEEQAGRSGKPLRVLRQRNAGLAAARNAGLALATCEYIAFLDGDDLIGAGFFEQAMGLMVDHKGLGGVVCWADIFGDGLPAGLWDAPQAELPFLLVENSVPVPCVMRTAVVRDMGGYDTYQRYNYEDWELSVRLLARGWPIVTIPEQMLSYRVRADSLYRTMTAVQHQIMREQFFQSHPELITRFAAEIALQVEHRMGVLAMPEPERPPTPQAPAPAPSLLTRARNKLGRVMAAQRQQPRVLARALRRLWASASFLSKH